MKNEQRITVILTKVWKMIEHSNILKDKKTRCNGDSGKGYKLIKENMPRKTYIYTHTDPHKAAIPP